MDDRFRVAFAGIVVTVILIAVPLGLVYAFRPRQPRSLVTHALRILAIVVASIPLGTITAFLLFPFWGWFEARTGIESLGHSGPADWCFEATMGVWLAVLLAFYWRHVKRATTPIRPQ